MIGPRPGPPVCRRRSRTPRAKQAGIARHAQPFQSLLKTPDFRHHISAVAGSELPIDRLHDLRGQIHRLGFAGRQVAGQLRLLQCLPQVAATLFECGERGGVAFILSCGDRRTLLGADSCPLGVNLQKVSDSCPWGWRRRLLPCGRRVYNL